MIVERMYIEAKKSKNFQTYTVGLDVEIDKNKLLDEQIKEAQAKCRKMANEQIRLDGMK